MKKKIKPFLPKYAYIPFIMIICMNSITYYGTKLITNQMYHYNATSIIDKWIPLIPFFVFFYLIAYIIWMIGYIVIAKESKEICFKILSAEFLSKLFCLFFFFIFPTTMTRPEITATNIFEVALQFIYQMDEPVNLFPSIHCLESWMCFRGSCHLKKVSLHYKIFMFICAFCICASTVLVKQHVLIDIIGGILVVEFSLFLANKFHTEKFFKKIETHLHF